MCLLHRSLLHALIIVSSLLVFGSLLDEARATTGRGRNKEPKEPQPAGKEICYTRQELTVRAGAFLMRVVAREGQLVKRGDLIAEFDNRMLKTGISEARAGVAAARANRALALDALTRLKQLAKTDTVAPQELFSAQMQVEKAQAQLDQAQAVLARTQVQLDDSRIVADIAGRVSGLPQVKGLYIQAGQSLGSIEADASTCAGKS